MMPLFRKLCQLMVTIFGLVALDPTVANSHFLLNLNVRIIHVDHVQQGLKIYMRLPMPYVVAELLGPVAENGLPQPAPYTTNNIEQGRVVHFVNFSQLQEDPLGLGDIIRSGFDVRVNGEKLTGTVEQVRVYQNGRQESFATLQEAKTVFQIPPEYPVQNRDVYVGDATVDVLLRYDSDNAIYEYSLSSSLNPGLPDQGKTANLILDYSPGVVQIFRERGLLTEPITISGSRLKAFATFVSTGIIHILEGMDHVLFVLCLVLGASVIGNLLWRITGFTIGHSITLSAGFFGFVPSATWFVPAVETGIALSIIYAAVIAIGPGRFRDNKEAYIVGITCLIGLLHGLGFSFVLKNVLQVTSPDIWQSLIAFNMGVEIGQVLIIVIAWSIFRFSERYFLQTWSVVRTIIGVSCITISSYWVVERMGQLLEVF